MTILKEVTDYYYHLMLKKLQLVEYTILYYGVADLANKSVTAAVYSNRDEKYSDVNFAFCGVRVRVLYCALLIRQDRGKTLLTKRFIM